MRLRLRLSAVVTVIATAAALLVATPAAAAPDSEGGTKALRNALESAIRGQVEAKAKLEHSKRRQRELRTVLARAETEAMLLQAQVGAVASKSYRLGRITTLSVLLNSGSPDSFLERVIRLDMMADIDGRALTRYRQAAERAKQAKLAIDIEIRQQRRQVAIMTKKRQQAEDALAAAGGGGGSGGFISANSPLARPAPRNRDGSWPREGCSVNDPTTSGCITPRTLHAYQAARAAGFRYYTNCYSRRSWGEHPKGRACDFSANSTGFQNVDASGGDRRYGNRLAAFFVHNAGRLGVMYVIWYRQIWMPGSGWRSYSGRGGPAAAHTNHVHVSML